MKHYKNLKTCRICGSKNLSEVIHIEPQFLSPTFVKTNKNNKLAKIKVAQTLLLCNDCNLLQMKETVNPDLLYSDYFYRSALSDTMRRDLKNVVDDVSQRVKLSKNDIVIDIGANDCTMISYYNKKFRRIAVEPAKNIDWNNVDKSITIVNDYFNKEAVKKIIADNKAKIVSCCAMFYDLDDPNTFVKDVKEILDVDGIWCIQLSYLVSMLKNMNFYDICNEHLEYYSLSVLNTLMEKNGLTIIDATLNAVNGGSARVFITHKEKNIRITENLKNLYDEEKKLNLDKIKTYKIFYKKILEYKKKVSKYIMSDIKKGKLVLGLGASTKGNMLIQTFGINKKILPYISERNPEKVGLYTLGTNIELISEEKARELNPSCMLVLPWYFKDEIVKREMKYIMNGGKLLFPMPYPHVVTKTGEINL